MNNLRLLGSIVIFGSVFLEADGKFLEYSGKAQTPYKYHQEISKASKITNDSLTSDVNALLAKLKSENKEMTYLAGISSYIKPKIESR